MDKFKIGDRVICLEANIHCPIVVGKIGNIDEISKLACEHPYLVSFEGKLKGYQIWCDVMHLTPLLEALC
jgi:hypothetical protein